MMKRGWTYMLIAIGILAGCVDRSYGGMQDEEIYDDTTEPIPVKVYVGSAETILPKGAGVMDDLRSWVGAKFYVYAFNNDMLASYDATSWSGSADCLIDGSKDVPGTLAGKEASISELSNVVLWSGPDETVIYPYGNESGIIYDFFAYYVDDIKIEESGISRQADKIMMQVEIDGTQDLMSSKARLIEDQLTGILDEDERLYLESYCYSYYAARKGIDPVFIFKHHLTKMDFKFIPAYNITEQRTVEVQKVEIRSRYRAQFTVADKGSADNLGLAFEEDYRNLSLREDDGSELKQDKYKFETLPTSTSRRDTIDVGTSILVAPAERYDVYVYMTETFKDGSVKTYEEPLLVDVNVRDGFLPGHGYVVNISVYGATRLDVDVSLVDWNSGGKITMDDEEFWGNNEEF